jgi:hypothetical protein
MHGSLGPILRLIDESNIIADCLEHQFTPHDFSDYDHKRQVEARVQALVATVDEDISVKFRPYDI